MNETEKIEFFDEHISLIFSTKSNRFIDIIDNLTNDKEVIKAFRAWPNSLKTKIVEKYYLELENITSDQYDLNTWDEFYEMYDGKFDEFHMLHITILARYKNQIEDLGYTKQQIEDDWHKPESGEYKLDKDGNLVIIHSCPDREIFTFEPKHFLDELGLQQEWAIEVSLSIM